MIFDGKFDMMELTSLDNEVKLDDADVNGFDEDVPELDVDNRSDNALRVR